MIISIFIFSFILGPKRQSKLAVTLYSKATEKPSEALSYFQHGYALKHASVSKERLFYGVDAQQRDAASVC